MNAATRYALATRVATAQGKTEAVPFPGDAYLSKQFDAAIHRNPVDAVFTFDGDGQCVALIRSQDRPALDALIAAVA